MIQQEESQRLPIFDDSTIVNNIADCDISDVVKNMEIGPNGSIILSLSPNAKSIMNSDVISLDGDQQVMPGKRSIRYVSGSSTDIHREPSPGLMIEHTCLNSQLCSSQDRDHPVPVYVARSRQSSSDQSLDALDPVENIHNKSIAKVLKTQESSQTGTNTNTDPKPCCSKTLDSPTCRASSRLSSSDISLEAFNPADNTNDKGIDNTIVIESVSKAKLNFPTPFKTAFFFPKSPQKNIKTRKTTKITPTVAIADEFIEYQRKVEKEKKEKSEGILKRRTERLQKQNERKAQNLLMIKKRKITNTENKIITSQINKQKNRFRRKSCIKKPTTLETIDEIKFKKTEGNNDDSNDNWLTKPLPFQERKSYSIFDCDSEISSDDQDIVTLNIKNQKVLNVKKSSNKLFGESSDSST